MVKFVLNDESVKTSHGFFLLNSGGDFSRFNDNPVMLYNHELNRLIGKWMNLQVEKCKLVAEPDFDTEDEESLKVKGKVERGYLKGASLGIIIKSAEWREEADGSTNLYVTEWELFEASIVTIPSNAGALSLSIYDSQRKLISEDNLQSHINQIVKLSINHNNQQMDKVGITLNPEAMVALGVVEASDASVVNKAILALHKKHETLLSENRTLKESAEAIHKQAVKEYVELALSKGKIKAADKESFVELGVQNFDLCKKTLDAIPEKQSLGAQISSSSVAGDVPAGRESWTLLKWMKEDMPGLNKIRQENPTYFETLKTKK